MNNYAAIIKDNIRELFGRNLLERATAIPAEYRDNTLSFKAFGLPCVLCPEGIILNNSPQTGPQGIVISLYALHAVGEALLAEPYKSFKELPDSTPYTGAFASRTEQSLVPFVDRFEASKTNIISQLDGEEAPDQVLGDIAFVVRPLPKISLCYICYMADEDFPAAVTCLYSQNAQNFLTTDALADLGEYTSKAIQKMME